MIYWEPNVKLWTIIIREERNSYIYKKKKEQEQEKKHSNYRSIPNYARVSLGPIGHSNYFNS